MKNGIKKTSYEIKNRKKIFLIFGNFDQVSQDFRIFYKHPQASQLVQFRSSYETQIIEAEFAKIHSVRKILTKTEKFSL